MVTPPLVAAPMTSAEDTALFTIATLPAGPDVVLRLRGELDLTHAHELRCRIRTVLADRDPRRLVVDLDGLDAIDSSGVAVLLWAHFRLAGRGHLLCLAAPSDQVQGVLYATGHRERLHTHPTVTDALHANPRSQIGHR